MTNIQYVSENLEASVISSLVKDATGFAQVEDLLVKEDFKWPSFQFIYDAMHSIILADNFPDKVSLISELERTGRLGALSMMTSDDPNGEQIRGKAVIEHLLSLDVNPDNVETYAFQLKEVTGSRNLKSLLKKADTMLEGGSKLSQIMSFLDIESGKISVMMGDSSRNIKDGATIVAESISNMERAVKGEDPYLETGISAWDSITNGLFPGRLYIVAAASNDGKTALALNLLNNICIHDSKSDTEKNKKKHKAFYVSLESGGAEIVNKLVQIKTGISSLRIERGQLSNTEMTAYEDAVEDIANSDLLLDDSPELILPVLRSKMRKAVSDGAKLIIIDQLEQLSFGNNVSADFAEYKLYNLITYRIKAYARELNVPVVLIHQMNRSADSGKNRGQNVDVTNADLNQAGEKAADAIVIIRHKKDKQVVIKSYLVWTKNRQGEKKRVPIRFIGERMLFQDYSDDYVEDDDGDVELL